MADQKEIEPYYRELTAQEKKGVDGLLEKLKGTAFENDSLTTADLLRFLRARNYDLNKSFPMLTEHLKWRKEYKPEECDPKIWEEESAKGYYMITPFKTKQGWPVVLFWIGLYDSASDIQRVAKFVLKSVEQCMNNGTPDKMNLLVFDRLGASWRNLDNSYYKYVVPLVEKNYPETMGCSVVVRTNWALQLVYKIAKNFIDKKTQQKIRLIGGDTAKIKETLLEFFDEDELWEFWGGKKKWEPENQRYLSLLGKKDDDDARKQQIESEVASQMKQLDIKDEEQADG